MQDLPAPTAGMAGLQVDVSVNEQGCAVQLGGELDMATAAQLRGALELVSGGEHRLIVVDLAGLRFVGLNGLQVLAEAQQTLQTAGCRLVLTNPDAITVRVLAVTGLDRLLHLATDPEQRMSEVTADGTRC